MVLPADSKSLLKNPVVQRIGVAAQQAFEASANALWASVASLVCLELLLLLMQPQFSSPALNPTNMLSSLVNVCLSLGFFPLSYLPFLLLEDSGWVAPTTTYLGKKGDTEWDDSNLLC